MWVLTASEECHVGLDGELEETLLQTPVVEDLRHVRRDPVSATSIFLDPERGVKIHMRAEGEGKKTHIEEIPILFEN